MADVFQIILRSHFHAKGRQAFNEGRARDSHGLNNGSEAIADFFIGYDAAKHASPASHTAPAGRQRIDARQAVAS